MEKIVFRQKDESIDPTLFSMKAEEMAKEMSKDYSYSREKINRRTQIRKFYDEILRLDTIAQSRPNSWTTVEPQLHLVIDKAAYAKGRDLVSDNFLNFIRESVLQVKKPEDLRIFATFFEALMGFYKLYVPKN